MNNIHVVHNHFQPLYKLCLSFLSLMPISSGNFLKRVAMLKEYPKQVNSSAAFPLVPHPSQATGRGQLYQSIFRGSYQILLSMHLTNVSA